MTIEKTALTIPDVAQILKVSEKTITRMLQDESIPGFKVANQWRFHPEDFDNWLKKKRSERGGSARTGIASMLSQELESVPLS
ncbi:MAG: helix-turn-helix domain-containing protein, partial [Spirochaetaceae bacterium]|nr:helix-turn-helix domain-containing protein [Spirochaetaceae bacterium]